MKRRRVAVFAAVPAIVICGVATGAVVLLLLLLTYYRTHVVFERVNVGDSFANIQLALPAGVQVRAVEKTEMPVLYAVIGGTTPEEASVYEVTMQGIGDRQFHVMVDASTGVVVGKFPTYE